MMKDKARLDKIARIGCIVCQIHHGVYVPAAVHHLTGIKYRATGKKANDAHTIPLCGAHHQTGGYGIAIHAGVKEWEKMWGTQEMYLDMVNEILDKLH